MRCFVILCLLATSAHAESRDIETSPHPSVPGLRIARQPIAATGDAPAAHVVFLNRGGARLAPGDNDARADRSTLITRPTDVPAWSASDEIWTATMSCIEELFAPYDIDFVETDPGDVSHVEAIFTTSPSSIGQPGDVAGVSPFARDCGVIENAIVFTFVDAIGEPRAICETMAQEIAHAYGLDHAYHAPDVMSYLPFRDARTFTDEEVECGELAPRPCGIDGSRCRERQRSARLLRQRVGEPPFGRISGGCATTRNTGWLIGLALLAISWGRAHRGGRRADRLRIEPSGRHPG